MEDRVGIAGAKKCTAEPALWQQAELLRTLGAERCEVAARVEIALRREQQRLNSVITLKPRCAAAG